MGRTCFPPRAFCNLILNRCLNSVFKRDSICPKSCVGELTYTSKLLDTLTGLYHFGARTTTRLGKVHDRGLVLRKEDPPSTNQYTCARDNQMRLFDAVGHAGVETEYEGADTLQRSHQLLISGVLSCIGDIEWLKTCPSKPADCKT